MKKRRAQWITRTTKSQTHGAALGTIEEKLNEPPLPYFFLLLTCQTCSVRARFGSMWVCLRAVTRASRATRPRNTFSTRLVYHLWRLLANSTDSSVRWVCSLSLSPRSVALACSVNTWGWALPYSGFFPSVLKFVLFVLLLLRTNIFPRNQRACVGVWCMCARKKRKLN